MTAGEHDEQAAPRPLTAPGRLQHLLGLIDDARYGAMLRERVDQLAGAAIQMRPALGSARHARAVVEALHKLDEELGLALRACESGLPADAGRHVECAEHEFAALRSYTLAVQELAAVNDEIDEAVRAIDLADYRALPALSGLYRAVGHGRCLVDERAPARALGIAQTVRRELARLFGPQSGSGHSCVVCRSAPGRETAQRDVTPESAGARSEAQRPAALIAALRASGHHELARRLACDIAAREARPASAGSGYSSAEHASRAQQLISRSQRLAEHARADAQALRSTVIAPDRSTGKEEENAR